MVLFPFQYKLCASKKTTTQITTMTPGEKDLNERAEYMWVSFLKRDKGDIHFNRSWAEYEKGFGVAKKDDWIGLKSLFVLANIGQYRALRVEFTDFDGNRAYAEYGTFAIGEKSENYKLTIGEYKKDSTAGDSLTNAPYVGWLANEMAFSAYDQQNDNRNSKQPSCTELSKGGWWHNNCHGANPTGIYRNGKSESWSNIFWYSWYNDTRLLKKIELKFKRTQTIHKRYDSVKPKYRYTTNIIDPYDYYLSGHSRSSYLTWLKRMDGSENFTRNWDDYKNGFGSVKGEFWLGLKHLHKLTAHDDYTLRVDLEDMTGRRMYAEYLHFAVGPESQGFPLEISGYQHDSTAGDSLTDSSCSEWLPNGVSFSTPDMDNDMRPDNKISCAMVAKSGWWFRNCHSANPTGVYRTQMKPSWSNIFWYSSFFNNMPLKYIEFKIKVHKRIAECFVSPPRTIAGLAMFSNN